MVHCFRLSAQRFTCLTRQGWAVQSGPLFQVVCPTLHLSHGSGLGCPVWSTVSGCLTNASLVSRVRVGLSSLVHCFRLSAQRFTCLTRQGWAVQSGPLFQVVCPTLHLSHASGLGCPVWSTVSGCLTNASPVSRVRVGLSSLVHCFRLSAQRFTCLTRQGWAVQSSPLFQVVCPTLHLSHAFSAALSNPPAPFWPVFFFWRVMQPNHIAFLLLTAPISFPCEPTTVITFQ